jgi:hypothetical protein
MRLKLNSRTNLVVLAAVGIVAAGGIGYAAIPGADGQIKACYATSNGLLLGIPHSKGDMRVIDEGETCRAYETTLRWNQKGVKGDAGPVGPAGPAGPAGDGAAVLTATVVNRADGNGWELSGGDAVAVLSERNGVYRIAFARPLPRDCVAIASPTSDDSLTSRTELDASRPEDVLVSFRSLLSGEPSAVLEFGLIVAC